ncbi:MAG: DNA adenine methylase [Candidatus Brocadiales bacterium]|nr:DNA adenine methylase [Candidatus Bathyanammoxibius amoris]
MKKITSPLRYPGSKNNLVKYIKKVLDFNEFKPDVLVEPFVGGGSVSLNFLLNNWVNKVIIADKDRLIYSFWKVVFNDPKCLIKFIKNVDINVENFCKYKKIATSKEASNKKFAEACIFLNRTSFSGILKDSTGPIGGKKQNAKYKINCRFNRKLLIEKIKYISHFKNRVIVLPYGWEKTIRYAEKVKQNNKIFFYFDPPFYKKGNRLYRHYFNEKEHLELSKAIKRLKNKWILSYDKAQEIKKMYRIYRGCIRSGFAFPYSINSPARRMEEEYFITPFKKPAKRYLIKDDINF